MNFKYIARLYRLGFWLLAMSLFSCAYRIQKASVGLQSQVGKTRIHVPIVDNLSSVAGPEMLLTSAIREVILTVPDVELVSDPEDADYFLLARITDWGRSVLGPTRRASAEDQLRGGLIEGQVSAADFKVFMYADFEFLENLKNASDAQHKISKSLWVRKLYEERNFEAYRRFEELTGASSAPHIHRSREEIQLKKISMSLARQVMDQVSQDF